MIIMIILFTKRLLTNQTTFSAVASDATGVELLFVARTASGSAPSARFCAALPLSPTLFFHGITATVPYRSFCDF
jgi:hypothetical protein